VATAMGTPRADGSDPVAGETGVCRALQRFVTRHRLGGGDASDDDCHLYFYFCRHLRGAVRKRWDTLGLCDLLVLWVVAMDHVSGDGATIGNHDRLTLESGETGSLPTGNAAGGPGAFLIEYPAVWDRSANPGDVGDSSEFARHRFVASSVDHSTAYRGDRRGVVGSLARRFPA